MKRIGIDIGTTSVSAAVWDDETRQLITARTREHRAGLPSERNGEVIQDPGIIVRYAEELLQVGTYASTSASLSTEFAGGIPSIRDRETIMKRIAEG